MHFIFNKKFKMQLAAIVFLTLFLTGIEAVVLNIFNLYVNPNSTKTSDVIQKIPLIIILALIIRMMIGIAVSGAQSHLIFSIQKEVYEKILKKFTPERVAQIESRDTAELARKILLDVSNFTNGILLSGANVFTEILMIVLYGMYFIYSYDFSISYASMQVLMLAILTIVLLGQLAKQLKSLGESRVEVEKKRFFFPNLLVVNHPDVHTFKVFNTIFALASKNEGMYRKIQTLASIYQNCPRYMVEAIILIGLVMVTGAVGNQKQIDPVILLFVVVRILPSFSRIISNSNSIRYYWSSANSLRDLLSNASEQRDVNGASVNIADEKKDYIRIEDVSLPFSSNSKLINAEFIPGINYLSGDSGAGKSTLLKVIIKLVRAKSGTIIFSNSEVSDNIAYIPQRLELMEASLEENIRFFRPETDKVRKKQILHISGLEDVLNTKGMDLATKISEGGANISGGQSQRLSIARGLYANPKVIILDETLSGIPKTDALNILDELADDRSKIVIITSHDPNIFEGRDINVVKI